VSSGSYFNVLFAPRGKMRGCWLRKGNKERERKKRKGRNKKDLLVAGF
jgi:hypothetical protein